MPPDGEVAPNFKMSSTEQPKCYAYDISMYDPHTMLDQVDFFALAGRSSPPPSAARKRAPQAGNFQTGRPISTFSFFFFFINLNKFIFSKSEQKFKIQTNLKSEQKFKIQITLKYEQKFKI
jgi:hypothetical protein